MNVDKAGLREQVMAILVSEGVVVPGHRKKMIKIRDHARDALNEVKQASGIIAARVAVDLEKIIKITEGE